MRRLYPGSEILRSVAPRSSVVQFEFALKGHGFHILRKNSDLPLPLGGRAAVYRCDKRFVFNAGFKPLEDCVFQN